KTPAGDRLREIDKAVAEVRKRQPRPLKKMYGNNPTDQQRAAHAELVKAYNRDLRSAGKGRDEALEASNKEFLASRKAENSVSTPAAEETKRSTLPVAERGTGTDVVLRARRGELNVRMGEREFPIDSIEDASEKFLQLRDKVGDIGGMRAVELVDKD